MKLAFDEAYKKKCLIVIDILVKVTSNDFFIDSALTSQILFLSSQRDDII
jgi:hypothetical protein